MNEKSGIDIEAKGPGTHPSEEELAAFLDGSIGGPGREGIEEHIASCASCLEKIVLAHDAVETFKKSRPAGGKRKTMPKPNLYLILAIIAFALSFAMPRYFLQMLAAAMIFGIKWIVDAKTTKMLVMIYEAWRSGGEKEASRVLQELDSKPGRRF